MKMASLKKLYTQLVILKSAQMNDDLPIVISAEEIEPVGKAIELVSRLIEAIENHDDDSEEDPMGTGDIPNWWP
jgi:hypothetical protein